MCAVVFVIDLTKASEPNSLYIMLEISSPFVCNKLNKLNKMFTIELS
jgi:hypothetical protein